MIWNKSKECMSRDEMAALQGKRLHKLVELVYHNVPFYREKMQALDLAPEDINSIEDIVKLPFTTKQDLRDNYPVGLQAANQSEIVRVHASSGTTGNPTIVGYTRRDLEIWKECSARAFTSYGVTRDDIFSVGYGYGLFTGGLGAHYGVEYVGATVIPTSTGNTDKHLRLLRDLKITGIACTPSYALYLAEAMERNGMTRNDIALRVGAFGAEPWTENMREEIEARLGLQAYNLYGLSEIIGPGVSSASTAHTSRRTTSIPRSSTPRPCSPCPAGRPESWSSPRSPKQACPCCVTEPRTSRRSSASRAPAAEPTYA